MNISKVDFKKIGSLLKICIIPILVGMLFVPFATGLIMRVKSSSGDVVTTYKTAFSFIFGGSLVSEHIAYTSKGCSPLGIVAYSLLAISLVLLIVSLFKKDRKSLILFLIILFC